MPTLLALTRMPASPRTRSSSSGRTTVTSPPACRMMRAVSSARSVACGRTTAEPLHPLQRRRAVGIRPQKLSLRRAEDRVHGTDRLRVLVNTVELGEDAFLEIGRAHV